MKIAILVEGPTEKIFKTKLIEFLKGPLEGRMPDLRFHPQNGRIPKEDKLQRVIRAILSGKDAADHVIALTDVYTGTDDFADADDAKAKMRQWVGKEERFHPHVSLHDFEAWLIPYWNQIQKLAGCTTKTPGLHPESINHGNPPSKRIAQAFRQGKCRDDYVKTRDGTRILRDVDLTVAINACPELKAFINTIITLSGGAPL